VSETPSTQSRLRSERWRRRRDEVVDIAAQVFAQRGYDATGISELCAATGLGKGGLYHYIESKDALLSAIFDRVMDEVMTGAASALSLELSQSESLRRLSRELLEVIARFPDHVRVSLHEFQALTGDRAERFRSRRRSYEEIVERVVEAGVRSGEFRPTDTRITALGWLGMHNYTYRWMLNEGLDPKVVSASFSDTFIRGLTTPGLDHHGKE